MSDIEFEFNSELPPLIPDGEYEVSFVRAERGWMGQEKLYLWFTITTPGEFLRTNLVMSCNVPPKGKWRLSHKYYRTWVLAAGRRPVRRDRISTAVLRNKIFRARIANVTTTSKNTRRTPAMQYSKIDELLEVVAGR